MSKPAADVEADLSAFLPDPLFPWTKVAMFFPDWTLNTLATPSAPPLASRLSLAASAVTADGECDVDASVKEWTTSPDFRSNTLMLPSPYPTATLLPSAKSIAKI